MKVFQACGAINTKSQGCRFIEYLEKGYPFRLSIISSIPVEFLFRLSIRNVLYSSRGYVTEGGFTISGGPGEAAGKTTNKHKQTKTTNTWKK